MLQSYVDAVIYRDILERHEVASVQSLKYVLQYLVHNFGRKTSVRAIAGVLKQLSLPRDRELSALRDARHETGIEDCTIVTWDEEGEEDGISIVPAWKWML